MVNPVRCSNSIRTLTCVIRPFFHMCIYPKSFNSSVHFGKAQQLFRLMLLPLFFFLPAPITHVMITYLLNAENATRGKVCHLTTYVKSPPHPTATPPTCLTCPRHSDMLVWAGYHYCTFKNIMLLSLLLFSETTIQGTVWVRTYRCEWLMQ
jgi:hypothetical protein